MCRDRGTALWLVALCRALPTRCVVTALRLVLEEDVHHWALSSPGEWASFAFFTCWTLLCVPCFAFLLQGVFLGAPVPPAAGRQKSPGHNSQSTGADAAQLRLQPTDACSSGQGGSGDTGTWGHSASSTRMSRPLPPPSAAPGSRAGQGWGPTAPARHPPHAGGSSHNPNPQTGLSERLALLLRPMAARRHSAEGAEQSHAVTTPTLGPKVPKK